MTDRETIDFFETPPGEPYDSRDPARMAQHRRARALLAQFNRPDATEDPDQAVRARSAVLQALLGAVGEGVWIEPPFFCDYGVNISIGARSFLNFNCMLLDGAAIEIGADVLVGPAAQILTVGHPLRAAERIAPRHDVENAGAAPYRTTAAPIRIGDRVWIGGGAVLLPGVSIGEGAAIGAGAVVTRSIPPNVFAAGTPCRVIRGLDG